MRSLQHTKVFVASEPALKDNAAFVGHVIDTAGMAYGEFHIPLGETDIAPAVLTVTASEVRTDANTLGGSPVTLKDPATKYGAGDDGKVQIIGINFVKNPNTPRYILLNHTAGNGSVGTNAGATFVAEMSGEVSDQSRGDDVVAFDYV